MVLLRGCGARTRVPSFREQHGIPMFMIAPTCLIRWVTVRAHVRANSCGSFCRVLHSTAFSRLLCLRRTQCFAILVHRKRMHVTQESIAELPYSRNGVHNCD